MDIKRNKQVFADKSAGLCFVGALPPPIHGLSMVNQSVREEFDNLGLIASVVDLSSRALVHSWRTRLFRLIRFARCGPGGIHSMLSRESTVLYLGLSAGYGQFYDCLFVLCARISRASIYLHHHSFSYLLKPVWLSRLLMRLAGAGANHIVLCEAMDTRLRVAYPIVKKTNVISNAVFTELITQEIQPKHKLEVIGYFGNISWEKGIGEFLDLMSLVKQRGHAFRGLVGGAFQDDGVRSSVMGRLSSLGNVTYVGPKFGVDKLAFFRDVDVLLFPSRYFIEAEPLTIHESMSQGVPVIAWERGCISGMLSSDVGRVIGRNTDFVEAGLEQILAWKASPVEFQQVSRLALTQHRNMRARFQPALRALLLEISEKC